MIDRARLKVWPASVDGRRRNEPVGDDARDVGGVVPNLLERDELKYEDDGRAGEAALMTIGDDIMEADSGLGIEFGLSVCSCS